MLWRAPQEHEARGVEAVERRRQEPPVQHREPSRGDSTAERGAPPPIVTVPVRDTSRFAGRQRRRGYEFSFLFPMRVQYPVPAGFSKFLSVTNFNKV